MGLFDTSGQEDYDRLRPLSYPETDIFLICAPIDISAHSENVCTKWVPEITHFCPGVPYILVGVKGPSHEHSHMTNVRLGDNVEYGQALAKTIGALMYLECDIVTQQGLKSVFDEVCCSTGSIQFPKVCDPSLLIRGKGHSCSIGAPCLA